MAKFYYGLFFDGRKCLHATSQKRALSHPISLAVNYRLFSHGDVSYRFNGKNDNVVLEIFMLHAKFQDHRDSDYEKEVFKAFYHIWAWCPSW